MGAHRAAAKPRLAPREPSAQSRGNQRAASPSSPTAPHTSRRALIERWRIKQVSLYVGWDGRAAPEHEYADLARSTRGCTTRRSCRRPLSRRSATSSPATEPLLQAGRDVLSIHIAGGLSGTCESAREAARAARRGAAAGAVECSTARPAPVGSAASCCRRGSPRRAPSSLRRRRRRGAAARPRHLVLPGHARVPASRRAHRRRAGDGRHGAENQADPHVRHRDRARRARAHAPRALERMSPTCASCTSAAPATGSCSTHRRPATPSGSSPRAPRLFGAEPLFCTEVGPVLGAHLGSGMLVGGMTR